MRAESEHCIYPVGAIRAQERHRRIGDTVKKAFDDGQFVYLTPKQRAIMTQLYLMEDGPLRPEPLTFAQCARLVHTNGKLIQDAHRRALGRLERVRRGEPPIRSRKGLTLNLDEVRSLFEAGWTRPEVAKELGCSVDTLVKKTDPLRRSGELKIRRGRPPKIPQEIIELYNKQSLTTTQIAEMLGFSPSGVRKGLQRLGIPRRNKGSRPMIY